MMANTRVGISIVGKDTEGVVAEFTQYVFKQGANIETISQNVIKGLFGMHLEVSFTKSPSRDTFDKGLAELGRKYRMDVSAHYEDSRIKKIAIFVTSESHCLEAILASSRNLHGQIAVIVGTSGTLSLMCKRARIPFVLVLERDQQKAESKILGICKKYDIDVIALARYMRILSPNFVWRYPNRIINIHPSLLPAFPGATAYAQAHERGTKIVGVTAHYVTESLDQGPIILQKSFEAKAEDTLEKIKQTGQSLEAKALLESLKMHLSGALEVRWRKVHTKKVARKK